MENHVQQPEVNLPWAYARGRCLNTEIWLPMVVRVHTWFVLIVLSAIALIQYN
jgi:hypothetical protein